MTRYIYILLLALLPLSQAKGAEAETEPIISTTGVIVADTIATDTTMAIVEVEDVIMEEIAVGVDSCDVDSAIAEAPHPDVMKVRDIKSIYCHPYSLNFNSPDWKRMWVNTSVLAGAFVGTLLVLECLPEDATAWNRAEIQKVPLFKRWRNHVLREGPEWDHDNPIFNYVLHPYAGAAYFMAARSCGFNFWRSLLYSACISTIGWEFGIEAFMERPSIQDLFVTPLVGSFIGEYFYKAKRSIVENDYELLGSKILGNIAVFLVDPVNEVVDIFRHRNTHCQECLVDPATGDIAYETDKPVRSVEGSLSPVITDSYKGFSLTITF